ncbi:DUF3460 family protein [Pseudoduganella sp. UC29_106]|uniref:DUF3460 family protein n=1 Tax=Pseudoduganella sp. UC29_106 TaxID=3374553 RepID=UPI003756932E
MKVKGYVSEFEEFFGHLLADHPEYVADQQKGWNIWWGPPGEPGGRTAGTDRRRADTALLLSLG